MRRIGNSIVFLIIMFQLKAFATVVVEATVDQNEVSYGETFTLNVSVKAEDEFQSKEPRFTDLKDFNLLNKWDEGLSVKSQMIAGPSGMKYEKSRVRTYSYLLSPKKEGSISLPPIEVDVDGQKLKTKSVPMRILPAGKVAKKKNKDPMESFFGQNGIPSMDDIDTMEDQLMQRLQQQRDHSIQRAEPQFKNLPTNPNEAFFVQVEADKTTVYEGEQITVNWYIYTRGQMETLDRLKFPSLKGFWKEIIEEVPMIQFSEEIINGVVYKKALLASHALFPIKAGTSVIDQYQIRSKIRLPIQGGGGFGFSKAMEFTKASEEVKVKVLPLPNEGRPPEFTGAVGDFDIVSRLDSNQASTNQPFSLKVRIDGLGNAKSIDLPTIQWPQGLELFDTKSDSKYQKNGRSFKEFELLVIPRQAGELTIPEISFAMFDPNTKKYTTKKTQPLKIMVQEGSTVAKLNSESMDSKNNSEKIQKPIFVAPALVMSYEASSGNIFGLNVKVFWPLIFSGILIYLGFFAFYKIGFRRKKKSALQVLKKKLETLPTLLKENNYRQIGSLLTNAYYYSLGVSIGEGESGVETKKLMEKVSPSLRHDLGDAIEKSFEIFQVLTFAPEDMIQNLKSPEVLKKNVIEAEKIIYKILEYSNDENKIGKN